MQDVGSVPVFTDIRLARGGKRGRPVGGWERSGKTAPNEAIPFSCPFVTARRRRTTNSGRRMYDIWIDMSENLCHLLEGKVKICQVSSQLTYSEFSL